MQKLHILLTHNKEHKKVFPIVPIVEFRNGNSFKDYLVRAKLFKLEESGRCEPCDKKSCLVCESISTTATFTTEACKETFKIPEDPSNCDSEKVLCLLKCKVYGETKFRYRFNNYKSKHRAFRKDNQIVPEKRFHAHYFLDGKSGTDDWNFVIFEQCETHGQLKERDTFWQHILKTFYPIILTQEHIFTFTLRFQFI